MVTERDIPYNNNNQSKTMPLLIRQSDSDAEVKFKELFENEEFDEQKVGVESKKEYKDVFTEKLDWEEYHQRWNSDNVQNTNMWEIDLEGLFDVIVLLNDEGAEVSVSDEVLNAYFEEHISLDE